MPRLVSEHIKKLREEIAEISEANRKYMHRRDGGAAADHERRLRRLQEILDELMNLTDWKKRRPVWNSERQPTNRPLDRREQSMGRADHEQD